MVTESPLVRTISPTLLSLENTILHGWDIKQDTMFGIAQSLSIAPTNSILETKSDLLALSPRIPPRENSQDIDTWILKRNGSHCGLAT